MMAVARQQLRGAAAPCQEGLTALLARGLSGSASCLKEEGPREDGTIDFGALVAADGPGSCPSMPPPPPPLPPLPAACRPCAHCSLERLLPLLPAGCTCLQPSPSLQAGGHHTEHLTTAARTRLRRLPARAAH